MNLKTCLIALAALAAMAGPAAADWVMVGQREVTDRAETDTIVLGGHRQYERIRLCVYRNPVHFIDLDIRYRNGGHQDASVASRINPGNCTRAIDLNGDDRDIERIIVRYEETSRRRARATVRVFAE
jgi:hypothetical protein